jgi:LytS/YehU family sensor histidine kinase
LLHGTGLQFLPLTLVFLAGGYILYAVFTGVSNRKSIGYSLTYGAMLFGLLLLTAAEGLDFMGQTLFGSETVPSYAVLTIMLMQSVIYLIKLRKNTRLALKSLQLENDYNQIKHTAMRSQINPHFVFNSLTSIQDQVHKSLRQGDNALSVFAKHLRSNVEADGKDVIPFEDELVNVNNYFSLENLRFEGKLTLLFDIDYTDFSVPVLSLQPLVENAVRYAQTDSKPDGYIQIASAKANGKIILTVKDNGKGFDPASVGKSSTGIKNAAARFAHYLDAEMYVNSAIGAGTEIRIEIPEKKKEKQGENE